MFQPGDRVRWHTTDNDGLPISRYGFVRALHPAGWAVVLLDDELRASARVSIADLAPVTVTAIELRLTGCDLLDDPELRHGLVSLWSAEAEDAGLDIEHVERCDVDLAIGGAVAGRHPLAQLESGGAHYVLHASVVTPTNQLWLRAEPTHLSA